MNDIKKIFCSISILIFCLSIYAAEFIGAWSFIFVKRVMDPIPDSVLINTMPGEMIFKVKVNNSGEIIECSLLSSTYSNENTIYKNITKNITKWQVMPFDSSLNECIFEDLVIHVYPDSRGVPVIGIFNFLQSSKMTTSGRYIFTNIEEKKIRLSSEFLFKKKITLDSKYKDIIKNDTLIVDVYLEKSIIISDYKVIKSIDKSIDKAIVNEMKNYWYFLPKTNKKGKWLNCWERIKITKDDIVFE